MFRDTILWPKPGAYILAISGGADSMVLLDVFAAAAKTRAYRLTIAHFDHGLRADSDEDRAFVETAASRLGLPYISHTAKLGIASEASARTARHAWLELIRIESGASAILTAHHQDDLLETSLLNLARGSGRLGLAPMQMTSTIARPLIHVTRSQLRDYAAAHSVGWREDPTNADISNARNLLRHRILPYASHYWRTSYFELITELAALNTKIDQTISTILSAHSTDEQTYSFSSEFIANRTPAELQEIILAAARSLRPGIQLDGALIGQAVDLMRRGYKGQQKPLRLGIVLYLERGAARLTTKGSL